MEWSAKYVVLVQHTLCYTSWKTRALRTLQQKQSLCSLCCHFASFSKCWNSSVDKRDIRDDWRHVKMCEACVWEKYFHAWKNGLVLSLLLYVALFSMFSFFFIKTINAYTYECHSVGFDFYAYFFSRASSLPPSLSCVSNGAHKIIT